MGCFPSKREEVISSNLQKIDTIYDFKITKGMLVQESKGDPEEIYAKVKIIGEGTFGKVFLGKHKISGVERAIKQIYKDTANLTAEEEKSLISEINVLKSLDHPNIMKVYEYYNDKKCFSIVSELCSGGELFKKISDCSYLNETASKYVMKQLLSAVSFCHKNGIIHRDLKPENILLEEEEENNSDYFTIKVIDFGTSAKFKKDQRCEEVIGTPFYIAPEVLNNKYDEKCDCWSCGVILYIMLCGDPPFDGDDDDQIYKSIIKGKVEFNQNIWSEVSNEAKDLIKKLLTKDPKSRYSAFQCLQHPWFNKNDINEINFIDHDTLKEIVVNLKKYNAVQKLQQASIAFIVHNLISRSMTKELRKCFILFDTNGDGQLDKKELINGLLLVDDDQQNIEKEVNRVMDIIDVDGNGFIEYEEFLRASLDKNILLSPENVKIAFQLFDKDNKGCISPAELKAVMGQNVDDINNDIWNQMVNDIDLNKDGVISFDEFDKMLNNIRSNQDDNDENME